METLADLLHNLDPLQTGIHMAYYYTGAPVKTTPTDTSTAPPSANSDGLLPLPLLPWPQLAVIVHHSVKLNGLLNLAASMLLKKTSVVFRRVRRNSSVR